MMFQLDGPLSALDRALMARAEAALDVIDQHPSSCAHLVTATHGQVCAGHPETGILCPACADRHDRTHDDQFRYRCDGCGVHDPDLRDAALPGGLVQYGDRLVPVLVVQMGGCSACHARAAGRGVG